MTVCWWTEQGLRVRKRWVLITRSRSNSSCWSPSTTDWKKKVWTVKHSRSVPTFRTWGPKVTLTRRWTTRSSSKQKGAWKIKSSKLLSLQDQEGEDDQVKERCATAIEYMLATTTTTFISPVKKQKQTNKKKRKKKIYFKVFAGWANVSRRAGASSSSRLLHDDETSYTLSLLVS